MPQLNLNPNDIRGRLASSFVGSLTGRFFPINSDNISADRALIFGVTATAAGEVAGERVNNASSYAYPLHGLSAAFIFKILGESVLSLNNTLTLFLISTVAPTLIEEAGYQTRSLATSLYRWYRPHTAASADQEMQPILENEERVLDV